MGHYFTFFLPQFSELLKDTDAIFPIFFYYPLICDFSIKSFRIIQKFSKFIRPIPLWLFMKGVIGGNKTYWGSAAHWCNFA